MFLCIGKLYIPTLPPHGTHRLTTAFHLHVWNSSHSWLFRYQQTARRQFVAVTFATSSDNPYLNFSNIISLWSMTKRFILYQNKNPPQRSCLSGRESIQRDEKRQQSGKRDHFKRRCDRLTFRPFPDPGDHLLCANDGCLVKHLPQFVRLQSNNVL